MAHRSPGVERLCAWFEARFAALDRRLGGWPALLRRTVLAFGRDDGPTLAAALAYYALFSFFPLLLCLVSLASPLLESQAARQAVLGLVERYLPAASELVQANLQVQGVTGWMAMLGFLWVASSVFSAATRAVNRAWGVTSVKQVLLVRLWGLAMVLGVGALLVASLGYSAALHLVRTRWAPLLPARWWSGLTGWLSLLVPVLVSVTLFTLLYRLLPAARVRWADAWPAGLAAGLAWEAGKHLFTWYLVNFDPYNLAYGSLATLAAFLLWSYLSSLILILGAEFSAQYAQGRLAGREGT